MNNEDVIFIDENFEIKSNMHLTELSPIEFEVNDLTLTLDFKYNEKIYHLNIAKSHIIIMRGDYGIILTARLMQYLFVAENNSIYHDELTVICPHCLTEFKITQNQLFIKLQKGEISYNCQSCGYDSSYIIKELPPSNKPIISLLHSKHQVNIVKESELALFICYEYYDRYLKDVPVKTVSYWIPKSKLKVVERLDNQATILIPIAFEEEKVELIISDNSCLTPLNSIDKLSLKTIFKKSRKWIIAFIIYSIITITVIIFAFRWYINLINSVSQF